MATLEVFLLFLKLGLTSFGGPVAHLGYFHKEIVGRRRWMSDDAYLDIVALCQFLPGPASSQVGMAVGLSRAGYLGAMAAWLGFTLPSAILLVLFAFGVTNFESWISGGLLHGLKIAAVAVVAQALWTMATKLCPDKQRVMLAVFCVAVTSIIPTTLGQIAAIGFGAAFGWYYLKSAARSLHEPIRAKVSNAVSLGALAVFGGLLLILPIWASLDGSHALRLFASFFRVGSLVFGGGHVVLPLIQAEVVPPGFVSSSVFMAGYGAAQAIPGPLFAFAAYLGAVMQPEPSGILGAVICLVGVFLPSFLLVIAVLPFWDQLRAKSGVRSALMGVNAAVVGLLLSAFYQPVWTSAISSVADFSLAATAFVLLMFWKFPSWGVVLLCGTVSGLLELSFY